MIYVDNFRAWATVGRIRGRWSHLTADTVRELHAFADSIGMRREWFQERCRACKDVCPHWHYDVVDWRRTAAIAAGAKPITLREMGEIIRARRAAQRVADAAPQRQEGSTMDNFNCESCGKTPAQAAIHRTSPKGEKFRGKCAECLGHPRPSHTPEERILDALTPIGDSSA